MKKKSSNTAKRKSIDSENVTEKKYVFVRNSKSFCVHFPHKNYPEKKGIESWYEQNRLLSNIFRRVVGYISTVTTIP